jgi:tol-pal system protein YbgF
MSIQRPWLIAFALALCGSALAGTVVAQEPQARAQPRSKATKEGSPAATPVDSQLKGRVDHLEEQLADMQVVVGTLESLGRGGGATMLRSGSASTGGGVDQARVDSLETQIRALAAQLEQLSTQVRQLSGNRRTDAAPLAPAPAASGTAPAPGGFGSTIVSPPDGRSDPIGRIISTESPQPASASPALPPAADGAGNPRDLYETAYGYLLQQDYGAAEASFDEFLRRYPGDRLAADAQYWLGEALYVQRRYKPAGQAFLAVIEKHKTSAKVPNSLLKLAMSLEQLGQKDCGIFAELDSRHPNAPADVRVKARALKQRQGC